MCSHITRSVGVSSTIITGTIHCTGGKLTSVISTVKDAGLICAIVAELLVLVATWRATYNARQLLRNSSSVIDTPLSRMLLRDGECLSDLPCATG